MLKVSIRKARPSERQNQICEYVVEDLTYGGMAHARSKKAAEEFVMDRSRPIPGGLNLLGNWTRMWDGNLRYRSTVVKQTGDGRFYPIVNGNGGMGRDTEEEAMAQGEGIMLVGAREIALELIPGVEGLADWARRYLKGKTAHERSVFFALAQEEEDGN